MAYSCADTGRNNGFRFCQLRVPAPISGIHRAGLRPKTYSTKLEELSLKNHRPIQTGLALLFSIALIAGLSGSQKAVAAQATTFSGRAFAAQATVLGITAGPVSDTGEASRNGDAREAAVLEYPISGVTDPTGGAVTAEVLHTAVIAHGNTSSAEASVASVTVKAAGQTITADFLMARASAKCNGGAATAAGSSEIVGLTVNGTPTTVGTAPNETVSLPGGGRLVINEQTTSSTASKSKRGITVNAIHLVVPGIADVIVASAHADIACGANATSDCTKQDFVTGGGFVQDTPSSPKKNFAVAGGPGGWGHLLYIDHGSGLKVKGTGVDGYSGTGNSRHISGTATWTGGSGTYDADVTDLGEPGRDDTFKLDLNKLPTQAQTNLGGGNIKIHCQ
jgi:hypothetical protein